MANFALIQAETVVQLFDTDPQLNAEIDVRDVSNVPGVAIGWHVDENGAYHPPAGYSWEQARAAAGGELTQTMNISVRCLERQEPVPNDWIIYRDTLRVTRDSETGDPTAPFPPRPVYPPGIPEVPGFPSGEVIWPPPATPPVSYILPSGGTTADLPIPQAVEGKVLRGEKVAGAPVTIGKIVPKRKMKFGMA